MLHTHAEPVTPKNLNIPVNSDADLPILVINDGKLMESSLEKLGFDAEWLQELLKEHGLKSVREVFFLSVNDKKEPLLIKKQR